MRFIKDHGETVEFELKFEGMNNVVFVKKEFLEKVPEPWNAGKLDPKEHYIKLFTDHKITDFLHNLRGPALINPDSKVGDSYLKQYLIDGKKIVDETVIAKMEHEGNFQDKFIDELTSAVNEK